MCFLLFRFFRQAGGAGGVACLLRKAGSGREAMKFLACSGHAALLFFRAGCLPEQVSSHACFLRGRASYLLRRTGEGYSGGVTGKRVSGRKAPCAGTGAAV